MAIVRPENGIGITLGRLFSAYGEVGCGKGDEDTNRRQSPNTSELDHNKNLPFGGPYLVNDRKNLGLVK